MWRKSCLLNVTYNYTTILYNEGRSIHKFLDKTDKIQKGILWDMNTQLSGFSPPHVKKQYLRLIAKHNLNSISGYEKGAKMTGKLKNQ